MRKAIAVCIVWLLAASLAAPQIIILPKKKAGGGGGGCTPASFSDNFDRADGDSLGANWTEAAGDADIYSNTYRLSTGSYGVITSVHNTSTGSGCTSQYAVAAVGVDSYYPWLVFRYTDSSSKYYVFQLDGNNAAVEWLKYDNAADSSGDSIETVDLGSAFSPGETLAITVEGTGDNTTIRLWRNVSGTPTSTTSWNGDTTPDGTMTGNPGANAVDTGDKVGIGGQQGSTDLVRLDNFAGGGLN